MTDAEIQRLRQAKRDVSDWLKAEDIAYYQLAEVDLRLHEYVAAVASHPDRHNVFEQLAVRQFLRKVTRYGITLAPVLRFLTFYERLYFPGVNGMQRYKLTPVQVFQFVNIFGFWENKRRVTKEVVLFVPRKFSKTTSTASLALYDLLFGDANAEAYTGANSADQAKKCFDVIRGAMRRIDPGELRYTINEQVIKSRRRDRTALAQCLTANARTKDGLNASTVIMDEFSQARDNNLLTVLTTSMGVRVNPLTVIITTASDVFDGPFYEMLEGYKSILLGDFDDDSVFAHLFMPDIDDEEGDENTWLKVHPHIGITVSLDFYRSEWKKAQRDGAEAMLAFRTKLLNVYSESSQSSWITSETARSVAEDIHIDAITGMPAAMCAIDLSEKDDFSAVTIAYYSKRGSMFRYHTAYFFPEGALTGHVNERLYRKWAADGHLKLTHGNVIDYREIVDYIIAANKQVRIMAIGYDSWKSQEVINMLAASGASRVLTPVKQTYGTFTAPVQTFEHLIETGHIRINDNPINYYCFGNAVLDTDSLENMKPVKRKHSQKIDGVITMLMCQRLFMDCKH